MVVLTTIKVIALAIGMWATCFMMLILFALFAITFLRTLTEIKALWNLLTFLNKED
jgi:hypothetical protein